MTLDKVLTLEYWQGKIEEDFSFRICVRDKTEMEIPLTPVEYIRKFHKQQRFYVLDAYFFDSGIHPKTEDLLQTLNENVFYLDAVRNSGILIQEKPDVLPGFKPGIALLYNSDLWIDTNPQIEGQALIDILKAHANSYSLTNINQQISQ
jgi:hypothetical protein